MTLTGSWIDQDVEEYPTIMFSVKVGTSTYLVNGETEDSDPTIIEALIDGTYAEYDLPFYPFRKSVAVAATTIVMVGENNGSADVYIMFFDTISKTTTWTVITATSTNTPRFGTGFLASDGYVYFPPYSAISGFANLKWLRVNATLEVGHSFTDWGGTWVASEHCGEACLGGDGMLYFTPGSITPAGGGYFSGERLGYIDVGANTVHYLTPPADPIWEDPEATFYWMWPAPDGVYACSFRQGFYKITTAGAVLLQTSYIYSDFYIDNGELTEQGDMGATPCLGADGLIYAAGSTYRGSSNYTPMLAFIDPADDSVHFQEFADMTGKAFVPTVTFSVGSEIRAFPYQHLGFDQVFAASGATSTPGESLVYYMNGERVVIHSDGERRELIQGGTVL